MTFIKKLSLNDVSEIQPLRTSTLKLIHECGTVEPDFELIVNIIQSDPIVASKIISMANSPQFGCSNQINSIDRAIVVLGIKTISNLAATMGTEETIRNASGPLPTKLRLYQHLLACGIVARQLATVCPGVDPNEAFIAGILHDIGKLLFLVHPENDPAGFCGQVTSCEKLELERSFFGVEHQEVGQRYASVMELPIGITEAIGNHHFVEDGLTLQANIWMANRLCRFWGIGPHEEIECTVNDHEPEGLLEHGLNPLEELPESFEPNELENLKAKAIAEYEAIAESICA